MRVFSLPSKFTPSARAVGVIAFHPSGGQLIAQSGFFTRRRCFNPNTFHQLKRGSDEVETLETRELAVACSPDGSVVAAGGEGGNLVLWDLDD